MPARNKKKTFMSSYVSSTKCYHFEKYGSMFTCLSNGSKNLIAYEEGRGSATMHVRIPKLLKIKTTGCGS